MRLIPAITVAGLIGVASCAIEQTSGERLERFVKQLPRNSIGLPSYWLEMNSLVGWEKMVLIFGYADNEPPCEALASYARESSPDRDFRCVVAN